MKQKKDGAVFWGKCFLCLLLVLLLFTAVSNAAASFTVAKVHIETPSDRKLVYSVKVEGRVEKNRELPVLSEPDLLVRQVLVNEGERVKKGETLAKLNRKQLREQIKDIEGEKRALELQNQGLRENALWAQRQKDRQTARAQEDYRQAAERGRGTVALAERQLQEARNDLAQARAKLQEIKQAIEKRKQKGQDRSLLLKQREQQKSTIRTLKGTVEERKEALKNAREAGEEQEKTARRALEDAAGAKLETDHSIEVNQISIEKINKQLEKLEKIRTEKGRILAPKDGVITSVLTGAGQKTADTALFTMTDDTAGLKFVGQLHLEDAKYVSVGDEVSLQSASLQAAGQKAENVKITSLETDEGKEFIQVTALLPAHTFSLGEAVSMEAGHESDSYPCTVPSTALRQEQGQVFVLLLDTEDTVLGKQEVARKMEVSVIAQSKTYAALESGVLGEDSQIITDTDRYVETGDRVRVEED